ncbi:MAG: phosphoribosylanthranilate isomerase [Pseudomonadota bacterium]
MSSTNSVFEPFLVKICGLTSVDDAVRVAKAGADILGFVLVEGTPRYVDPKAFAELVSELKRTVSGASAPLIAALTVNADESLMSAASGHADIFQLHGDETPAQAKKIRAAFGKPVVKAIGVDGPRAFSRAIDFAGSVDALLLDSKPATVDGPRGGTGVRFDWSYLQDFKSELPFLLAGGLTPDNVVDAVSAAMPLPSFCGVDVSSGVEVSHGVKDTGKVSEFVAKARSAFKTV